MIRNKSSYLFSNAHINASALPQVCVLFLTNHHLKQPGSLAKFPPQPYTSLWKNSAPWLFFCVSKRECMLALGLFPLPFPKKG